MPDQTPRRRIRSYRDLHVWQSAITLVVDVYALSRAFPSDERFGLSAQIRRAAVSVASNIAEGHSRAGRREYRRFVSTARGSLAEVETQLTIATRLGFIATHDVASVHDRAGQIGRMLTRLHKRLGSVDANTGRAD